jgi:hypothetical protein
LITGDLWQTISSKLFFGKPSLANYFWQAISGKLFLASHLWQTIFWQATSNINTAHRWENQDPQAELDGDASSRGVLDQSTPEPLQRQSAAQRYTLISGIMVIFLLGQRPTSTG